MRSLHDVPQLKAILMEETKNVTADIERYVDFRTLSSNALLANHPGYDNAIYETGDYISNQIDVEADKYYAKATELLSQENDMEESLTDFCKEFTASFWRYHQIAETYYSTTHGLAEKLQKELEDTFIFGTIEWTEANKKATEYRTRATLLHKALAAYVVRIFRRLSGLQDINRTILLTQTKDMKLFASKSSGALEKDRDTYKATFDGSTLEYIYFKFLINTPGEDMNVQVFIKVTYMEDETIFRDKCFFHKLNDNTIAFWEGIGSSKPGNWKKGLYKYSAYVGSSPKYEGTFTVY